MMNKLIIIAGGTYSNLGKGTLAASIALLLKFRGHNVSYIKFDPYYSVSAGTLSPVEHGSTYCLKGNKVFNSEKNTYTIQDAIECDMDLGHIEMMTDITLTRDNICTTGVLLKELIDDQENGKFLGKTVSSNPHLTDKIINRVEKLTKESHLLLELGGTVDENDAAIYLQAVCQLKQKYRSDCIVIFMAPVLWVDIIGEFKTKPLQRGVRDIQSFGIIPDFLICRCTRAIPNDVIDKIATNTIIPKDCIFTGIDCKSIYEIPLQLYDQNFDDAIVDKLSLGRSYCKIKNYRNLIESYINIENPININIAVIGKYINSSEAYFFIKESLNHVSIHKKIKVNVKWTSAGDIEKSDDIASFFNDVQGVIIPGGFDSRFIEGKLKAIKYCRENKLPILGICLGLQCMVIDIARNCLNLDADSMEFDKKTPNPVVHYMPGQENIKNKSGTMRLGSYECELEKESLVYKIYGEGTISERHRHRLYINTEYLDKFKEVGFKVTGTNLGTDIVEVMELDNHPFFIGVQFHPEFESRIMEPAPLFNGLVDAALAKLPPIPTT